MPKFKKSQQGYMMQPKGMGQQGYSMMVNPKKKSVKPPKPFSGKSNFGEIRPASSKATQLIRKTKAYFGPEGRGSNFGLAAGLLAPVPGKKLKMVGKIAKAFGNTAKQYLGQVSKFGFKKTKALRKQGITDPKSLQYADKSWTPSKINKNIKKTKNVPIVGTNKTMKVSAKSDTKAVSFVNPRISMTAAERIKAGY